jgi:hypothetical protein
MVLFAELRLRIDNYDTLSQQWVSVFVLNASRCFDL